ncbi:hypothetical protein EYF80_012637 [Liparis tanakae]|uniref:Uncharacterized protein n=1 Tax=Liparis tanakae TaxID=230148 RepID=A0A4Z2IH48_9TELE|nr:hypothetical protein EYF80_012637 [Liparis tanakae]
MHREVGRAIEKARGWMQGHRPRTSFSFRSNRKARIHSLKGLRALLPLAGAGAAALLSVELVVTNTVLGNQMTPAEMCWSSSCDQAGALCRDHWSSGAEMCVARPGSDRPLVGQAAGCGATLAETLDGPSLDSTATGHGALRQSDRKKMKAQDEMEGGKSEKKNTEI